VNHEPTPNLVLPTWLQTAPAKPPIDPVQFRQEFVAAFEDMTPRDSDCQACGLKHLPAIMVCGWFIFCLFLGVFAR
jgi:hypothetical protein